MSHASYFYLILRLRHSRANVKKMLIKRTSNSFEYKKSDLQRNILGKYIESLIQELDRMVEKLRT